MVVQATPLPAPVQPQPRVLPDLALILPAPSAASVPKYGGVVTGDVYDSIDCACCGQPVFARPQVGPGIKVRNVIPIDENGYCPSCAWDADIERVDCSPEAIANRIHDEVEQLGHRIGAIRKLVNELYPDAEDCQFCLEPVGRCDCYHREDS